MRRSETSEGVAKVFVNAGIKPGISVQDPVRYPSTKPSLYLITSDFIAGDNSNAAWLKKVVSSGTLGDRSAALVTLVQEDPVHNLTHLDNLVNMVLRKDRRESMAAIGN